MTKQEDTFPKHGLRGRKYQRVYHALIAAQDGRCAVCHGKPGERWWGCHKAITKLVIEHCHKTGKIRGLVCTGCNNQLAFVEHERLKNRPEYSAYLESRAKVGWSDSQR